MAHWIGLHLCGSAQLSVAPSSDASGTLARRKRLPDHPVTPCCQETNVHLPFKWVGATVKGSAVKMVILALSCRTPMAAVPTASGALPLGAKHSTYGSSYSNGGGPHNANDGAGVGSADPGEGRAGVAGIATGPPGGHPQRRYDTLHPGGMLCEGDGPLRGHVAVSMYDNLERTERRVLHLGRHSPIDSHCAHLLASLLHPSIRFFGTPNFFCLAPKADPDSRLFLMRETRCQQQ